MSVRSTAEIGSWIFRRRTWLPLLFVPLLLLPGAHHVARAWDVAFGATLLAGGEMLRLVSVGYAGRITRTRSGALGPLVVAGPYRYVRNPLYLGNLAILAGAVTLWGCGTLAPVAVLAAGLYYHCVVRWEEGYLLRVFGQEYADFCAEVPRWVPRRAPAKRMSFHRFDASEALQSERGTLGTLAVIATVAVALRLTRL